MNSEVSTPHELYCYIHSLSERKVHWAPMLLRRAAALLEEFQKAGFVSHYLLKDFDEVVQQMLDSTSQKTNLFKLNQLRKISMFKIFSPLREGGRQ